MASVNFSNPNNVVSFCETRLDPHAINKLIKENNGLKDQTAVDEALSNGDYKRVLTAIWSEKDKERRLTWLRSKQNEFHAPLLFEHAIAEFVTAPTINTLMGTSLPLSLTAKFRVSQDAQCCRDASVFNGDASVRMFNLYTRVQDNAIKKYCKPAENVMEFMANVDISKIFATQGQPKLLELMKQIAQQNLPSPEWIGYHGMSAFINGKIDMHPFIKWQDIRDMCTAMRIKALEQPLPLDHLSKSQSDKAADSKMDQ